MTGSQNLEGAVARAAVRIPPTSQVAFHRFPEYHEPWHLRFVGMQLTTDIATQGVTLEEYIGAAPR